MRYSTSRVYKFFILFMALLVHCASVQADDEQLANFLDRYGQAGQFAVFREQFEIFEVPSNFTDLKTLVSHSSLKSGDLETTSMEDQFAGFLGKPVKEFGSIMACVVGDQKDGALFYGALDLQDLKDNKLSASKIVRSEKFLKSISQSLENCTETQGKEVSYEVDDLRSLSSDKNKKVTLSFVGCVKRSEIFEIMVNGVPSPDHFGTITLGKVPLGMLEWDIFQVSSDRKQIERYRSRLIDKGEPTDSFLDLSNYQ